MIKILSQFPDAEKIIFVQGQVIGYTHALVSYIYFLDTGKLEYYFANELTQEKTKLITSSEKEMVVGWEAMMPTRRLISHVSVNSTEATLFRVPVVRFMEKLSPELLKGICDKIYKLIEVSFYKQTDLLGKTVKQRAVTLDSYFISQQSTLEERVLLLRSSPFFGEFKESDIVMLAKLMKRREYEANELIYDQDEHTHGIFVLIQGEVSIRRQEGDTYLNLRSISTPGYIFGWSAVFDSKDICRASTEFKTSVYFVPLELIMPHIQKDAFGLDFYQMVIWLMGNQLQMSHSRYIALKNSRNQVSIKQLIDVNASRIPLSSPLHTIPHLLKKTGTHHLAFSSLHELNRAGTRQERHVSSICLDLLKGEERELAFLNAVAEVYQAVSRSTPDKATHNRKICAKKTRQVFDQVPLHLEGEENLPDKAGHIFIYNHLLNHPHYTLNNHFQLTLDSHFISAMILDKNYDDPGIRTVRYGKSYEFGHQEYYDNLGYLNVYTGDSDLQDVQTKEEAKTRFFQAAQDYLKQGINLIISPEGTSFITEESPGPFKMGPFNIADTMTPEPYIVPVVFCNFDKRITEKHFFCRILSPFKLSERKKRNQSLKEVVADYREEFKAEVNLAKKDADLLFQH